MQTKFEQTVWFHVLAFTLLATFATVWFAVGVGVPAWVNSVAGLSLLVSLYVGVTRGGSVTRFAARGVGIGTAAIVFGVASVVGTFPLTLAYFMFPPSVGVALCGWRYLRAWVVTTLLAMAAMSLLVLLFATHWAPPALPNSTVVVLNGVTVIAMFSLGTLVLVVLAHDHAHYVKQQRAQQQTLREANARLAHAQEARDRFFAAASHELRTPMSAIAGISELMRPGPQTRPADVPLIGALQVASQHLLSIINDLLDLSKLRENKLQLVASDFDAREAIAAAFAMVRNAQGLHSDTVERLRLHVSAALPARLHGDGRRLTQIVLNLLNNAVKFTPAGEVSLMVRGIEVANGTQWRMEIEVQDTGIGMSSETMAKLFTDFTQADEAIAANYGGTGLGLSITKRLVELMGGKISVSSELGRGSTFRVMLTLPIAPAPVLADPTTESKPVAATCIEPRLVRRILVVDDHDLNRMIAKRLIQKRFPDVMVECANDGAAAVHLLEHQHFDLVFMDMQMPVMDGLTATRAIRALPDAASQVPIVAMTANGNDDDVARCLDAGMNAALCKPVDPKRLALTIEEFLDINQVARSGAIVIPTEGDFYITFPRADSENGN